MAPDTLPTKSLPAKSLHDTDVWTWTKRQAEALRAVARREAAAGVAVSTTGGPNAVDWENVIEEIESLGSEQEHALESHLANILSHLLKLQFSPASHPVNHWRQEVAHQRTRFERRLKKNPGLKPLLAGFLVDAYADARREAAIGLEQDGLTLADLPENCPYTLEHVRDFNWFPVRATDGGKD